MEFLIISGLSGAGKSRAADMLEDLDFYCVDNMPVALLPKFAELCLATRGRYERVALVTDVRERESFDELFKALDILAGMKVEYKILFMTAEVDMIVKRYKETRRRHPLAPGGGSLETAVRREMKLLEHVRDRADYVVDTSHTTLGQLQSNLYRIFMGDGSERQLSVNVMAFGFKYGIPMEADLVFDVRFLPNPFYIPEMREKNGLDREVRDYVFSQETTRAFMTHLEKMVKFLMPLYIEEGKHSLTIAIGCTGGKHRSVAVADSLCRYIKSQGQGAVLITRDMEK